LVDNQTLEDAEETLIITLTDASATVNGTTQDIKIGTATTTTVNIKNDKLNVKWQTIAGADTNKATLSDDPNAGGQRVFPEKSTPTGVIENKFELVFELEVAATADTILYYKIFDPDNYIGLGNDFETATAWKGDDNYAELSVTTGSVTITAGAISATLTIVVYPEGYTGTKLTSNVTTIVIDSVHAGDNFIVVADTNQANVNAAALGQTENTRYKETNGYSQTDLLTVWRTLNVELDVATWDNMPAGNLNAPLDGFVATELARACIVTKEFTPNNATAPNVGNDGVDETERTLINGNGANSGRDISGNSAEFWTVRIVTIPYYNNEAAFSLANSSGTFQSNTITVCYQKLSNSVTTWNNTHDPDFDLQDGLRFIVLHEIGHVLLTEGEINHTTESSIMKSSFAIGDMLLPENRRFLLTQIQLIQLDSWANN
jgi:hypothetical protein